ncbi:hypothetical protein [Streptomyces cyanogenus]|uniref:Uncharacterized protein n=1 Tax=Streptomyces cyanogenus TaxID=80860 RepID=A0ABX7TT07_STRCY|nr:hypothetical protein [Streptomyces cyanogenus]QTD99880.1 hypothetical protein S1361_21265 [Streptomyces cyanogenus]
MRTKPIMRDRTLRSVLVAALSAATAVAILCGHAGDRSDVRADTHWPVVAVNTVASGDVSEAGMETDGAGS